MARTKGSKNKKYAQGSYVKSDGKHIPPGKNTFSIRVDTSGVNDLLASIVDGAGAAVRPAAQAGSQVFSDGTHSIVDGMPVKTGNLRDSIYQVYSKANSKDGQIAEYHVSWNVIKAPHGRLVEWGHMMRYKTFIPKSGKRKGMWTTVKSKPLAQPKQVAAHSFIRRASVEYQQKAIEAMSYTFSSLMSEAIS
ncbi:MAG: hypothetical protein CGW95_04810 [Phenylobacterium zucineum]|nr:MAG: hypothetical protein CGW95_04810 [Phenylobacterium zucineum]